MSRRGQFSVSNSHPSCRLPPPVSMALAVRQFIQQLTPFSPAVVLTAALFHTVSAEETRSSLSNSLSLFVLGQAGLGQMKSCFSLFLFYFGCFNMLGTNNVAARIGCPAFA